MLGRKGSNLRIGASKAPALPLGDRAVLLYNFSAEYISGFLKQAFFLLEIRILGI